MTLYSLAESNIRKTWFYLITFLLFIIFLGWLISWLVQSYVILWIAVGYSIITAIVSYWHSDKIVLAISKAKEIEKKDNPELYRLVENLCITAGLPLPKIYIIDSPQPNAFATGRDPKHSAIAVTTGLLEKLERSELEGVLAHELSHIKNRDTLLATVVVILVGIVVTLTDIFFRVAFWGGIGRRDSRNGGGAINLVVILVALVFAALAPLCATLIKLAISRKREFLADASGALLTRYPEGLARALEKISQDTHPLKTANNSTAHLYIVSPFRGKERKGFLRKLFSTHPPVEERIKALRGMKI